jgi:AcrR family transcriptional regulator
MRNQMVTSRDAPRTRAAILAAAAVEFAGNGLAGARIDAIAAAAGVNKRMLYHYFDSKDGLFEAVRVDRLRPPPTRVGTPDLADRTRTLRDDAAEHPDELRLLMWEELERGGEAADAPRRAAAWRERVTELRDAQRDGRIHAGVDAALLELACAALALFPLAFPKLARMITGHAAGDPEFDADHRRVLALFAEAFEIRSAAVAAAPSQTPAAAPPQTPAAPKPRFRLAAAVTQADQRPDDARHPPQPIG